jgi:hypothetical protein
LSAIDTLLPCSTDFCLEDPKTGNNAFHGGNSNIYCNEFLRKNNMHSKILAILILNKWATVNRQDVCAHLMPHLQDYNSVNSINGDTILIMGEISSKNIY